jgi:hypothetical protein
LIWSLQLKGAAIGSVSLLPLFRLTDRDIVILKNEFISQRFYKENKSQPSVSGSGRQIIGCTFTPFYGLSVVKKQIACSQAIEEILPKIFCSKDVKQVLTFTYSQMGLAISKHFFFFAKLFYFSPIFW